MTSEIALASRRPSYVTMEALALISALCIAAIFVYAQYARQADDFDQQAARLARDLRLVVEAFFAQNPAGSLSAEGLKNAGAAVTPPLEALVPSLRNRADDWQVQVYHPQGQKRFLLSASGVREEFR